MSEQYFTVDVEALIEERDKLAKQVEEFEGFLEQHCRHYLDVRDRLAKAEYQLSLKARKE